MLPRLLALRNRNIEATYHSFSSSNKEQSEIKIKCTGRLKLYTSAWILYSWNLWQFKSLKNRRIALLTNLKTHKYLQCILWFARPSKKSLNSEAQNLEIKYIWVKIEPNTEVDKTLSQVLRTVISLLTMRNRWNISIEYQMAGCAPLKCIQSSLKSQPTKI